MTRRALAAVVVAALLSFAAPATAAQPEPFGFAISREATNPCSGEFFSLELTFEGQWIDTGTGFVVSVKSSIVTSDGFVGGGPDTYRAVGPVLTETFNYVIRNPETGAALRIQGRTRVDRNGEVQVSGTTLTCIREGA